MKERSDRLEEACELIHLMFNADGPVSYDGKYYRLDKVPFSPEAGVSETYFSHLRVGDVEQYQQVEEKVVAAFDQEHRL